MKLHYYGGSETQLSSYEFESFSIDGKTLLVQCSGLFGVTLANGEINNPSVILLTDGVYHRFVLEDFKVSTNHIGQLLVDEAVINTIAKEIEAYLIHK